MGSRELRRIAAGNEALIAAGGYETEDGAHRFSPRIKACIEYPEAGHGALIREAAAHRSDRAAEITVVSGGTLSHAEEAVLNFADAFTPGGAYLMGAPAQEECLCRESTLYASLSSPEAAPFYERNRQRGREDGAFLFSPHVEIFRAPLEEGFRLLSHPKTCAVITAAAPDLRTRGAWSPDGAAMDEEIKRRMRAFLAAAYLRGCKSLTLGAWGCGVFGHDAADMARRFREVLIAGQWQSLFSRIVFAVYGGDPRGRYNREAFRQAFEKK